MMKKSKNITPSQIRSIVYGENIPKIKGKLFSEEKKSKPVKKTREPQKHDLRYLLDLPFSTNQASFQYPVPEWFLSKDKVDVSIVIPLYQNNIEEFVKNWEFEENLKTELIFVDDNCPLDTKSKIVNLWQGKSEIGKIFWSEVTQGYPACCNIGAEESTGDIVVFLHPDSIPTKGWLRSLIRLARKQDIGVVGAFHIDKNNFIIESGQEWNENNFANIGNETYKKKLISSPFHIDNCPDDLFSLREVDVVSSYCMAVKRNDFIKLGGFSPNLVSQQWADADFCCFVKEKGQKVVCQPNSPIYALNRDINKKGLLHGENYFYNKWIVPGRFQSDLNKKVDNVLIRRQAAHGDVLIASSVASAIKDKFPDCKITFSTNCPEVVYNNPWIDRVTEERSERLFDWYVNLDMISEYRPNTNILTSFAESIGVKQEKCQLFIHTEKIDVPKEYMVVHAGKTLWAGRNWSDIKFNTICKKIKEKNIPIICVGTETDHKTLCDLDLRGKTSIHQLAYVIKNAKFFIGIDSFPMHIAQVFDIPSVVFFGSIKPDTRIIKNNIKPVVAEGLSCLGCHHRQTTPCPVTSVCELGVQECINNVSTEKFWKVVETII